MMTMTEGSLPKASSSSSANAAIDVLSRDLLHSRQIAQRLVSSLGHETNDGAILEGLSPERTLLLEEHMANIALRWIAHQEPQDIEHISLRDFSQLTKLLMDLVERRHRIEQRSSQTTNSEGITPQQYAAMRQVLMGEAGEVGEAVEVGEADAESRRE